MAVYIMKFYRFLRATFHPFLKKKQYLCCRIRYSYINK